MNQESDGDLSRHSKEHNCGIAIVKSGKLIFALSEERAILKKFPVGFPKHVVSAGVEFLKAENLVNGTVYISVGGRIHVENFVLREKPNQLYDLIHNNNEIIFHACNDIKSLNARP
jgi:predicted NodU family carbamoyl transferase